METTIFGAWDTFRVAVSAQTESEFGNWEAGWSSREWRRVCGPSQGGGSSCSCSNDWSRYFRSAEPVVPIQWVIQFESQQGIDISSSHALWLLSAELLLRYLQQQSKSENVLHLRWIKAHGCRTQQLPSRDALVRNPPDHSPSPPTSLSLPGLFLLEKSFSIIITREHQ